MNTKIIIRFADGTSIKTHVTDAMEKYIKQGMMFSVSTANPSLGEDVTKAYLGNPMAALGKMLMLSKELKSSENMNDHLQAVIKGVDGCIQILSEELTAPADKPENVH